jgi:hypothetical protein
VLLNVQIPAEESDENVVISITDTSCTQQQALNLLIELDSSQTLMATQLACPT